MLTQEDFNNLETLLAQYFVPNDSVIARPMEDAMNMIASTFTTGQQLAVTSYSQQDWNGYEIQFIGADCPDAILHIASDSVGPDVATLRVGESFRSERSFDRLFTVLTSTMGTVDGISQCEYTVRVIRDRYSNILGWQGPKCLGVIGSPKSGGVITPPTKIPATGSLILMSEPAGVASLSLPQQANGKRVRVELMVAQTWYTGVAATDVPIAVECAYDNRTDTVVPPGAFFKNGAAWQGQGAQYVKYVFQVEDPLTLQITARNANAADQYLAYSISFFSEDATIKPFYVHNIGGRYKGFNTHACIGGYAVHSQEAQSDNPINWNLSNRDTGAGVLGIKFRRFMPLAMDGSGTGPVIFGSTAYDSTVAATLDADGSAPRTAGISLVLPYWNVQPTVVDDSIVGIAI